MQTRSRPLLLIALALVYAALAWISGQDRQSLYNLSRTPPRLPLAAFGHLQDARLALAARDADAALAASWQGVRIAPSEAASASLLGAAYFMKGDLARAHAAFGVARRLGWRDVPTQAYWLLAGIAQAKPDLAAQHLDALMRGAPGLTQTREILLKLEADPRGRAALARRLAEGPGWMNAYAVQAADLPPQAFANRMALLREVAGRGKSPGCGGIGDAVNRLAYQAERYGEALELWRVGCAPQHGGLLANGDFAQLPPDPAVPFDWTLPGSGGVAAEIDNGVLIVRNDSPGLPVVAQQVVLANPGTRLHLAWQASPQYGQARLGTPIALRCPDGLDLVDREQVARSGQDRWQTNPIVPQRCAYLRLEIRIPREAGEVRFEQISLTAPQSHGQPK